MARRHLYLIVFILIVISTAGCTLIKSDKEVEDLKDKTMPLLNTRSEFCAEKQISDIDKAARETALQMCGNQYDNITLNDKDKIANLTNLADAVFSRENVSDYSKSIINGILDASWPPESEGVISEEEIKEFIDKSAAYEKFKKECNAKAETVRQKCPAVGYSSWYFKKEITLRSDGGARYDEDVMEDGGPCSILEAGAAEEEKRQNNFTRRHKLLIIGKAETVSGKTKTDIEKSYYFDAVCDVSCVSFNCPKFENYLQSKCERGFPVYYPQNFGIAKAGEKEWQEAEKELDQRISDLCQMRSGEEKKKCQLVSKCGTIAFDGKHIIAPGEQQLRYGCCSCARKELNDQPFVSLRNFDLAIKCGGSARASGEILGDLENKIRKIKFILGKGADVYEAAVSFDIQTGKFISMDYPLNPGEYEYRIIVVVDGGESVEIKRGDLNILPCKKAGVQEDAASAVSPEQAMIKTVPICGDGAVNQGKEECDPPGKRAQCREGGLCSDKCLCEYQQVEDVCGDGKITGREICDGNKFSEQCLASIREYQERSPWLVPRCFNNCRGFEASAPNQE